MEYVPDGDLDAYIRESGPVPERIAASMTNQTAAGLAYLHRHRVIHRDLKPGNLLLAEGEDGNDVLKIADFGLSRDTDKSSALMSTACGTRVYMAPEVIDREQSHYTKKCDVWSMGCILFELWCAFIFPFDENQVECLSSLPLMQMDAFALALLRGGRL